jgi:HlyD family secretion protein
LPNWIRTSSWRVENGRAKVEAEKAKVTEAAATIEERRGQYERRQVLFARQATSAEEVDLAKAAYNRAIAQHAKALADVRVAEADLRVYEINLLKACICSPIDGVVLARNVDPGQIVSSDPVLFVIARDLRRMELRVDVAEAAVGKIKIGQPATFKVEAYPDARFRAQIKDIRHASELVHGVVSYKATLSIDNPDLLIRPGMTAKVEIIVQQDANVLLVPNAALRFSAAPDDYGGFLQRLLPGRHEARPQTRREEDGTSRTVWVLRNGVPVALPVTIGATDGRQTEITSGDLVAGQTVIIDAVTLRR